MAQWVKVIATMSDSLNLILKSTRRKEKPDSWKASSALHCC